MGERITCLCPSQVRLFADDTAVYLTIGGAEDGKVLQTDLDRLSVWEDRWDMEFNPLSVRSYV